MRSAVLDDRPESRLDAAQLSVLFRQAGVPATEGSRATPASMEADWKAFEESAFDTFYAELEQAEQMEQLAYQRLDERLSHIPAALRTEHRSWYHPRSFATALVGRKRLSILATLLAILAGAGSWMFMSDGPQSVSAPASMSHAGHGSATSGGDASVDAASASAPNAATATSQHVHGGAEQAPSTPNTTVSDTTDAAVGPVDVQLGEFFVRPADSTLSAGKNTLSLRNAGKVEHELMVIRTDRVRGAIDQMSSAELHDAALTSVHGLKAGDRQSVDVVLASGSYILFCNLPGHFSGGQQATITVA